MRQLLWGLVVVGLAAPVAALAQFYGPVPFYAPSTAAESYQRGFADVVRSAGQANLLNSVAVQNLEQARAQEIDNRVRWTESYYQMRQANRAYRASKRSPRLSDEEIVRIARQGLPNRLTSADLDPLTGKLNWPIVLLEAQYTADRQQLDKAFSERAMASSVSPALYQTVSKYTSDLLAALKKNINSYKPNDWLTAKKFVESLAYEVRFPAG